MILLVHSARDIAGTNIAKTLHQNLRFQETNEFYQDNPLYEAEISGKPILHATLKDESIYAQNLQENFPKAETIVFLSRHSSQSGTPTLSVHTPGNIGAAEFGGLPRTVSVSPAKAMQTALKTLNRIRQEEKLDYQVSYECTHHGPSLNVPTMFVELGSGEKQWREEKAAAAVAKAAIEAVADTKQTSSPVVLGIGGTHYNAKFTQMALREEATFGHMIPKHAIPQLNAEMLRHCIERTQEPVEQAVLDWKGIRSQDKPRLTAILNEIGLQTQKA